MKYPKSGPPCSSSLTLEQTTKPSRSKCSVSSGLSRAISRVNQSELSAWLAPMRPGTQASYRSHLSDLARFLGMGTPEEAAKAVQAMNKAQATICAEQWGLWQEEQGVRGLTVRNRVVAMRSWLSWLDARGLAGPGPIRPKIRASKAPPVQDAADLDAIRQSLEAMDASGAPMDTRDAAIIAVLATSLARVSEVAGLTGQDLRLDEQEIDFRRKGGRVDRVHVPASTVLRIRRWILVGHPDGLPKDRPLWAKFRAGCQRTQTIAGYGIHAQAVRAVMRNRGLPPPHAIRRGAARWAARQPGVTTEELRGLLGHTSLAATVRYTDDGTDSGARWRDRIADKIRGRKGSGDQGV